MQRLVARHKHAAELETRAQQNSNATEKRRSAAMQELPPPPEAALLGPWLITREETIAEGFVNNCKVSLGHKLMSFETLSSNGDVAGHAMYRDFTVWGRLSAQSQVQHLGIYPYVVWYAIDGKLIQNNICEFDQVPFQGDFAQFEAGSLYYYPLFARMNWEGDMMYGEIRNDAKKFKVLLRAVRMDDSDIFSRESI